MVHKVKSLSKIEGLEVGDVFYTSWGYDQTNYDFVVVESISPTGKTAYCRLAKLASNEQGQQVYIQKPSREGYGPLFKMKIEKREDGTVHLRGSYPFVSSNPSMQSKRLGSFYKADKDQTFSETDPMFGH